MMKFALIAPFLVTFAAVNPAQATQYVVNGDFSSVSNGLGQLGVNTTATDWSTHGYNIVMNVADQAVPTLYGYISLWDAANGGSSTWNGQTLDNSNFVAMLGDVPSDPVAQTVTGLTPGQTYTLSFIYSFGQQYLDQGASLQNLAVDFGGSTVFNSGAVPVAGRGFAGWQTVSTTVTATSASQVLSFLSSSPSRNPPFALFADVSLTDAVPEPETWAMMLFGLGMIGYLARRRQNVAVAAAIAV